MRISSFFVLIIVVCVCLSAHGQPPKSPAKLESLRTDFQKVLEKAQSSHDDAAKLAAEDYKLQLTQLLDAETKAGRLDSALLVRDEIKNIDAIGVRNFKVSSKAELKKSLSGSKWKWHESPLTLQTDGYAKHPTWEANKLIVKWEVVDRRTVLLIIEKGRDQDRYSILEFSEGLDSFKGFDFGSGRFDAKKRIPASSK